MTAHPNDDLPPTDRDLDGLLAEAHVRVHDELHRLRAAGDVDEVERRVWECLLAGLTLWSAFYIDDLPPTEPVH